MPSPGWMKGSPTLTFGTNMCWTSSQNLVGQQQNRKIKAYETWCEEENGQKWVAGSPVLNILKGRISAHCTNLCLFCVWNTPLGILIGSNSRNGVTRMPPKNARLSKPSKAKLTFETLLDLHLVLTVPKPWILHHPNSQRCKLIWIFNMFGDEMSQAQPCIFWEAFLQGGTMWGFAHYYTYTIYHTIHSQPKNWTCRGVFRS